MCQSVNLSWKIAVQNAGCVFAYFCGGHRNNVRLQFCGSFNETHREELQLTKIICENRTF